MINLATSDNLASLTEAKLESTILTVLLLRTTIG